MNRVELVRIQIQQLKSLIRLMTESVAALECGEIEDARFLMRWAHDDSDWLLKFMEDQHGKEG